MLSLFLSFYAFNSWLYNWNRCHLYRIPSVLYGHYLVHACWLCLLVIHNLCYYLMHCMYICHYFGNYIATHLLCKLDSHNFTRCFATYYLCSGFWGVLCAGIFSRKCLIKEVYEKTCFCTELHLPEKVSDAVLNHDY